MSDSLQQLTSALQELTRKDTEKREVSSESLTRGLAFSSRDVNPGVKRFVEERRMHLERSRHVNIGQY